MCIVLKSACHEEIERLAVLASSMLETTSTIIDNIIKEEWCINCALISFYFYICTRAIPIEICFMIMHYHALLFLMLHVTLVTPIANIFVSFGSLSISISSSPSLAGNPIMSIASSIYPSSMISLLDIIT